MGQDNNLGWVTAGGPSGGLSFRKQQSALPQARDVQTLPRSGLTPPTPPPKPSPPPPKKPSRGLPGPLYCILACEQWSSPLYCDSEHPQDLEVCPGTEGGCNGGCA